MYIKALLEDRRFINLPDVCAPLLIGQNESSSFICSSLAIHFILVCVIASELGQLYSTLSGHLHANDDRAAITDASHHTFYLNPRFFICALSVTSGNLSTEASQDWNSFYLKFLSTIGDYVDLRTSTNDESIAKYSTTDESKVCFRYINRYY